MVLQGGEGERDRREGVVGEGERRRGEREGGREGGRNLQDFSYCRVWMV